MKKYITFFIMVYFLLTKAYSQESYFGGNGSGFTESCYTQVSLSSDSIFMGGSNDGFAESCYTQANSIINSFFMGGSNDGFAESCYTQVSLSSDNIFMGGSNDGFAESCYTQVSFSSDSIFMGGSNDGFAESCYTQVSLSSDNIFMGGNAAGFTFICRGTLTQVPLPIKLLSFDAILNGNRVDLLWSTVTEINNDYFTIEKTTDDITFEEVAIVSGAGNNNTFISYSAVDENPSTGVSYYRLKQTDFDGNYSYSKLVPIRYVKSMQIKIFPNPVHGNIFYLSINNEQEQDLKVIMYNAVGKVVYTTLFTQQKGEMLKMIKVSSKLATGIYFVVIKGDRELYKQKLIVK